LGRFDDRKNCTNSTLQPNDSLIAAAKDEVGRKKYVDF
jgi:hypothetical protein